VIEEVNVGTSLSVGTEMDRKPKGKCQFCMFFTTNLNYFYIFNKKIAFSGSILLRHCIKEQDVELKLGVIYAICHQEI